MENKDRKNRVKQKMAKNCCYMDIPLTLLDIHRIARFKKIKAIHINKEIVAGKISENSSLYKIRKKEDGSCQYLSQGKCTIRDVRPNACRFYNFSMSPGYKIDPGLKGASNTAGQTKLLEHIIATKITRLYIAEYGLSFNNTYYQKSIQYIKEQLKTKRAHKLRIGKNGQGQAPPENHSPASAYNIYPDNIHITLVDVLRAYKHLEVNLEQVKNQPQEYLAG
jgi:Fe-S-cluster containining protein